MPHGGAALRGAQAGLAACSPQQAGTAVSLRLRRGPPHLSQRPSSFWNCERIDSTSAPTRPNGCRPCSGAAAAAAAAAGGWAVVRHCCCRRCGRPMAGSGARPASLLALSPPLLLLPLLLLLIACPARCARRDSAGIGNSECLCRRCRQCCRCLLAPTPRGTAGLEHEIPLIQPQTRDAPYLGCASEVQRHCISPIEALSG